MTAVIADDHRVVAEGVRELVAPHFRQTRLVGSGDELVSTLLADPPDVVIADIEMPGVSGLDALRQARGAGSPVPFVILTMHSEPMIAASVMEAGANAYVLKSAAGDELLSAIQDVMLGRTYVTPSLGARSLGARMHKLNRMTPKQKQILSLVGQGLRTKQIATELGLSVRTVEAHKYSIMQILGVHSTMEMVKRAEEQGLLF